ncbi:MAG: FHA domain-containing protein [Rhodospirillaceae bacterium]
MIRRSTFEITVEIGGKPEIEGIYEDEKSALVRAEYLLQMAKYTAVRVTKVSSRGTPEVIFEKFYTGQGKGATISSIEEAYVCQSALDVFGFESRQTLLRLLRSYFDQQLVIPLELLHNYMLLRYLERDPLLFNQAGHRLAAIQARDMKQRPMDRHDALSILFREVLALAKAADEFNKARAETLTYKGLSALISEVEETLPSEERARAITGAVSRRLEEARDWGLKLVSACELYDENQSDAATDFLDGLLAEIIDGNEPVRTMIGYAPDLASALESMLATIEGMWDDRLPGTPALQKLSDIMAHRQLPRVREALLTRVANAINGKGAMTKLDRLGNAEAFKRLVRHLVEFGGFKGGVEMSSALSRRAKVVLGSGGEDLSFEGTVSILASFLPNPGAKIGFQLDLLSSEFGRRKAAYLTQNIAEMFSGLRSIRDFAPDSDMSLCEDTVREDFRRRLYRAGIPRRLADGLMHKLSKISPSGEPAIAPATEALALPAPVASAGPISRLGRLELTYRGTRHMVDPVQTPYQIGRNDTSHLVVTSGTASRAHAEIQVVGEEYILVDHSKNGTYLHGDDMKTIALLNSSAPIKSNGFISIGTESSDGPIDENDVISFKCFAAI